MQTQALSNFKNGDSVEFTHRNGSFYPATVLRASDNHLLLQYHTLSSDASSNQKPFCQRVNVASVRPKLPHDQQVNPWFRVGDSVDAYRDDVNGGGAWCPGTVDDIMENSRYAVSFRENGGKSECGVIEQCRLRLHREWVDGNWVPPFPSQKEQPPETVMKPGRLRFKIKFSRKPLQDLKFKKGGMVEVGNDDEGYKGAWFVATIVDLMGKDKLLVQYRDLTTDDGSQLLKEEADAKFVRPCPPEVTPVGSFKQFQEVDAWSNDGWWEGVVLEVVNRSECYVSFINNEVLKFENLMLRPHQDWIDGKWVMPSKNSSELAKKFGDVILKAKNLTVPKLILKNLKPREPAEKPRDETSRTKRTRVSHFYNGAKVEVRSDEDGYLGSWYTAMVVDYLQNDKYLVEYTTLKTEDLTEQLKEEANASDMRPFPPDIERCDRFAIREWVDAWYNDGWWVGQVSFVLPRLKYRVYFWITMEEMEFEHCHLRPHQQWIDGEWIGTKMKIYSIFTTSSQGAQDVPSCKTQLFTLVSDPYFCLFLLTYFCVRSFLHPCHEKQHMKRCRQANHRLEGDDRWSLWRAAYDVNLTQSKPKQEVPGLHPGEVLDLIQLDVYGDHRVVAHNYVVVKPVLSLLLKLEPNKAFFLHISTFLYVLYRTRPVGLYLLATERTSPCKLGPLLQLLSYQRHLLCWCFVKLENDCLSSKYLAGYIVGAPNL